MKIAIIGTGIAGNTAAYTLHPRHDVTVFEAGPRVGGHTHTVRVELDGETHDVDTGFIVFNELNYPRFTQLLDTLGVASQPTSMSFSVRCDRTGLEYNGANLDRLFAQRRNLLRPRFYRMLRDILRFGREAPLWLAEADDTLSVESWSRDRGYSEAFVEHYLVPLGAALWSCPPATFRQFSMKFVVDFLHNHAMLRVGGRPVWRVVKGGSRTYVDAMTRPFADRIRLNCPVRRVTRGFEQVIVQSDAGREIFDHAIFACHADQALKLLADPSPVERELLGAFPYQRNDVVLHTDTSVLPRRRKAWASWNARLLPDDGRAVITYNMSMLQSLRSRHTFCVTLNHTDYIDPARIIRRMTYDHPLYLRGRDAARARHRELINHRHTSYCGAYWGFGFHEDGVRSAQAVCEAMSHRREVAHA
jgi:predicted NAD/FAD-binding protein